MVASSTALRAAVAVGLAAGALSALGKAHLGAGTLAELANSLSTWLVAPFLVGALTGSRRSAAFAGFTTSAMQLAGFYVVAHLQGIGTTGALVAFWTASAVAGGPIFGVAGQLWRTTARGPGMAVLAGVFIAEGLYAYLHQRQQYVTGVVWIAIGLTLALGSSRGRIEQWRWLGLAVPLGVAGEVFVTTVLNRLS